MLIGGFQSISLIDYPEKISSVIFLKNCNFSCGFCHNKWLLQDRQIISKEDIIKSIKERKDFIEGIVVSGGEPLLDESVLDLIKELKELKPLKIDTNGSNPVLLKRLIDEKLVDYVAMDVKCPLHRYHEITGYDNIENIQKSIDILKQGRVNYEFRTTMIPILSDNDFIEISKLLKGARLYVLQQFRNESTLDDKFHIMEPFSIKKIEEMRNIVRKNVNSVMLRNIKEIS